MKALSILALLCCLSDNAIAQKSYVDWLEWQRHYKQEHVADPRSPVKASDTAALRFYSFNEQMVLPARIKRTKNAKPFDIATHSGKTKKYVEYGVLTIIEPKGVIDLMPVWLHRKYKLHVYQSLQLMQDSAHKNYLFIPFNDLTNGATTYGGGRYIDLKLEDFNGRWVTIDFNRAYNPYCAFAEGFSCPIPPAENRLPIEVRAGEMIWTKATTEH